MAEKELLEKHLNEIAEKLWNDKAAIMVGAGFSKNADKAFPDWTSLGQLFAEQLDDKPPSKEKKNDKIDPILLAEEYSAVFGRKKLEKLIVGKLLKTEKGKTDLSIHKKLVKLPWTDIFTTNYDMLLEDAVKSCLEKKFNVVTSPEELFNKKKPRIVKLHGTRKKPANIIITQEDYRTYTKKFASFVNTIQQSLLENILCLVGFSGNDPNFLQWCGWLRDNVKSEKAPRIYLINTGNKLRDSNKKLLEERKITPVELYLLWPKDQEEKGQEQKHRIKKFLEILKKEKQTSIMLKWPYQPLRDKKDNLKNTLEPKVSYSQKREIVNLLEKDREAYSKSSGWCILPKDQRNKLWDNTKIYLTERFQKMPDSLDLKFAFELNWRLEKCLCPITFINTNFEPGFHELFEDVLGRYKIDGAAGVSDDRIRLTEPQEKKMWLSLSLSMLRFYREAGMMKEWDEKNKIIDSFVTELDTEQKAFLGYERVLHAFFNFEFHEIKSKIDEWQIEERLSLWNIRKAGVLAGFGQIKKARKILEKSLKKIRAEQEKAKIEPNYLLLSGEAIVIGLLDFIGRAERFSKRNPVSLEKLIEKYRKKPDQDQERKGEEEKQRKKGLDFEHENDNLLSEQKEKIEEQQKKDQKKETEIDESQQEEELRKKEDSEERRDFFRTRINFLKNQKCGVLEEFEFFENKLESIYWERQGKKQKSALERNDNFISNMVKKLNELKDESKKIENCRIAYGFLRYFEELGFPFVIPVANKGVVNLGKPSAIQASSIISKISTNWALITALRTGDIKAFDGVLEKSSLTNIDVYSVNVVDSLVDDCVRLISKEQPKTAKLNGADGFLCRMVPEILSRLCCKCSEAKKEIIIDFIHKIYGSEKRKKYCNVRNLVMQFVLSLSVREFRAFLQKLLNIPFPACESLKGELDLPNPFWFMKYSQEDLRVSFPEEKIEIDLSLLWQLAESGKEYERKWALYSLVKIYELGLLNETESSMLGKLLWSNKNDFPTEPAFYKAMFLKLPHPENIELLKLVKEYIQSCYLSCLKEKEPKNSTPFLCDEILRINEVIKNSSVFSANISEIILEGSDEKDIWSWWFKWWESKKYSYPKYLIEVLICVVLPNLKREAALFDRIRSLVREIESTAAIPCLSIKTASFHLGDWGENELIFEIESTLCNYQNDEAIAEGIEAILKLVVNGDNLDIETLNKFMAPLVQFIRWRPQVKLENALNAVIRIISFGRLNLELEEASLHCLSFLIGETELEQEGSRFDLDDRILLRSLSAKLAYRLFLYYKEQKREIPEKIIKWQNICKCEEEFAEIRKQWLS